MAPVASSQSSSSASSAGVRGVGVRRLRSQLAIKAGLTQKQAARFLKALVEEVEERVLSDGQLRIPDLVVFKMKARAARRIMITSTTTELDLQDFFLKVVMENVVPHHLPRDIILLFT
jgi:nucleoid DNA-binding protein